VDQLFLRSALAGRANRRRGPPPRRQKLGVTIDEAVCVLPDFRYHASAADGTVENEICPVFCARAVDSVRPAPDGVMDYRWVPWLDVRRSAGPPWAISPWAVSRSRC
jgi:isopentenyl-diphosphate delta-isomerase